VVAEWVFCIAVAVILPGPLGAQTVELVPYGGGILPLGRLFQDSGAKLSHRATVTFGGRLDLWLRPSAALEVVVGYAPSGYHFVKPTGAAVDTTGGLFSATCRLVYRFARTGMVSWHLLAGAGVVRHSGNYISSVTGKSHLTGVVGATGRFEVSWGTAVVLAAEDYVSAVRFGGITGSSPAARLNNDVVVSLGIVVPLGASGDDDYLRVIR
jgi:hypothetical protein